MRTRIISLHDFILQNIFLITTHFNQTNFLSNKKILGHQVRTGI